MVTMMMDLMENVKNVHINVVPVRINLIVRHARTLQSGKGFLFVIAFLDILRFKEIINVINVIESVRRVIIFKSVDFVN